MKQKMVIKVTMPCDKCRSKAMGLIGSAYGVISVSIIGDARDRLEVVGDGFDSVSIVTCLRKKVGHAEILQVEKVEDKKPAEEDKKKKPEEEKKEPEEKTAHPMVAQPLSQWPPHLVYYHQPVVTYEEPSCRVM